MITAVDIADIAEELERLGEELTAADEDDASSSDTDPGLLIGAMRALLDELRSHSPERRTGEQEQPPGYSDGRDLTVLGDHGIDLLARLATFAGGLQRPQLASGFEGLALPLACWVARQGAELNNLGPVVNSAAALANKLKQPAQLAELYGLLREVGAAVSPRVSSDTPAADPAWPWRVFLLNQAIVATRSHQPALMEEAFEVLVEHLPDEAPDFFREGMGQMGALDYPPQVRAVMEHFYDQWCQQRTLH